MQQLNKGTGTSKTDVISTILSKWCKNLLGHFFDMAEICAWFLEDDREEQENCLFHIDLLSHVKNFFHHSQHVLDQLGSPIRKQIYKGITIALYKIDCVIWLEFVEAPNHGDAMMALNPIGMFYVGVEGVQDLLIEGRRGLQLAEIEVWHLDGSVLKFHSNSKIVLKETDLWILRFFLTINPKRRFWYTLIAALIYK